jgi:hypothetical protein
LALEGNAMNKCRWMILAILVLLVVACGSDTPPTFTIRPEVFATATPFAPTHSAIPPLPTDTLWVPPTFTPTPPASATASAPTPTGTSVPALYRVAYVLSDDVLNIRSGAGVQNPKVGELAPHAGDVRITGGGRMVAPSLWVPISSAGGSGWVNSRFLTGQVSQQAFCQDTRVEAILDAIGQAIENKDGDILAGLIHPARSLRLRHSWSGQEVNLTAEEAAGFFTASESYDWGGGVRGPIRTVIVPLLEKDFVAASDSACGELIGGGAGALRLPFEYQTVSSHTRYRPAPEGGPTSDWGSWVIGVEYWEGMPYLGFLVHYGG